jgi:hypothetical protein
MVKGYSDSTAATTAHERALSDSESRTAIACRPARLSSVDRKLSGLAF